MTTQEWKQIAPMPSRRRLRFCRLRFPPGQAPNIATLASPNEAERQFGLSPSVLVERDLLLRRGVPYRLSAVNPDANNEHQPCILHVCVNLPLPALKRNYSFPHRSGIRARRKRYHEKTGPCPRKKRVLTDSTLHRTQSVSYTHLTLPTICSV